MWPQVSGSSDNDAVSGRGMERNECRVHCFGVDEDDFLLERQVGKEDGAWFSKE